MKLLIAALAFVSVGFSVNAMADAAKKSVSTKQCAEVLIAQATATYQQRLISNDADMQNSEYTSKRAAIVSDFKESKRQILAEDACSLMSPEQLQALQN